MTPETHDDHVDAPAPSTSVPQPVLRSMRAIGTTAIVAVTAPAAAARAETILGEELVAIDAACSRFRPDSELSALNRAGGIPVNVSALLFEAITVALEVAQRTGGAVDPTVGAAIEALGYDRDFEELGADTTALVRPPQPAPGWWEIDLDPRTRTVRVPPGTHIDLGASAKALVTDRAAQRIAHAVRSGVLVSIGGDVAVAGPAPEGGWAVGIAHDSSAAVDAVDQVVAIATGGIASSSTAVRTWQRGARRLHHIVDPATGDSAAPHWTLVSASGASCVEANAASTAAVVWGEQAVPRLVELGQPARLVRHDGQVLTLNGWPAADERGPRS
ncbi:MAG TPA: FAD:protein FMN transferase [Acidimicrobiales bacterium]|nr:FAD:protein FMN transferase [Acidimicrobiales bacterium]